MKTNAIKNWICNTKKRIEYFFYPERNRMSKQSRLNRRVANIIKEYFEYDRNGPRINVSILGLTKISVRDRKSKMMITIELYRPGLLIGKTGRTIDAITAKLTDILNKPVHIHIVESYLF